MAEIWKTETSHSVNQRAETQRLRNKYPLGIPFRSLTCSDTKLYKLNSYLYFDQIYCQEFTFRKSTYIWNMQICELLLVATGTPVWEARVCLTCKYFSRLFTRFLLCPTLSFWRVSFTHLYTTALSLFVAIYHTCHRDNQILCRNIQFCKMLSNHVCHKRKLLNMKWCDTLVSLIQTQHLQTETCSVGVIWQVRL